MRVAAVNIKRFRAFRDFWFVPNEHVNVIIGPNNIGKTALLDALALVLDPSVRYYRDDVVTRFDFNSQDLSEPVEIRVWLALDGDEPENVRVAYQGKLTKWRVDSEVPVVEPVTAAPMAQPDDLGPHKEYVCLQLRAEWDEGMQVARVTHGAVDEVYVSRWELSRAERGLLEYRHYGSRRDALRELSFARGSALAKNLNEKELAEAFRVVLSALEKQADRIVQTESVTGLLKRLDSLVAREVVGSLVQGVGARFTATFLEEGLVQLRRAATLATTEDEGAEGEEGTAQEGAVQHGGWQEKRLPLSSQGHGIQNLLLLAYLADGLSGAGNAPIVSVEEPEQNLEPPLVRWVFGAMRRSVGSAAVDAKRGKSGQVFITTHSPVLVSEAGGAEGLVLLQARAEVGTAKGCQGEAWATGGEEEAVVNGGMPPFEPVRAVVCSRLDQETRKSLERNSHLYSNALFARQVLLVEGDSEVGFLPVAFEGLSRTGPCDNPFHLGLEVVKGGCRDDLVKHAKVLVPCGKVCHALVDRDWAVCDSRFVNLLSGLQTAGAVVSCWSDKELLSFTEACDLEAVLAAQVVPETLYAAVREVYEDAGHDLEQGDWVRACGMVGGDIREKLPCRFPDLSTWGIEYLEGEDVKRAFLYAALHGPHECKAAKDMRIIAEQLAANNAVPKAVKTLLERILGMLSGTPQREVSGVYLAP